jgi:hypothetical protein
VKTERLISEHEYLFGTKKGHGDSKIIDVQSKEDFPTLFETPLQASKEGDSGPLWSTPSTKKGFSKKQAQPVS